MSQFQIGGKKGRGTADHVITINNIIHRNKMIGKKTYLVFGDAEKCFDKLWLKDCIIELYKTGMKQQDVVMVYLMNEKATVTVRTPIGDAKEFETREIVKQGTVWGPEMCCLETDSINRIGEGKGTRIGRETIGVLGYVDDLVTAGNAEQVKRTIRSLREMEELKKFTFSVKKTKYMVIETGKEEEEKIEEMIEKGKVEKVDEYKYLGLWINSKGNYREHITKKGQNIKGQVMAIKSLGSWSNVGPMYINVRLQLFEACIIPSLLYQLEACKLSKDEIKKLENIQGRVVCSLMEIPKTTPYIGLLHELGMWKMGYRLAYRRIMLYQNIIKTPEERIVTKIVKQQQEEDREGSFYKEVEKETKKIHIEIEQIKKMEKSNLKKSIKEGIKKEMEKELNKSIPEMKKLRFMNTPSTLKRQGYITELEGEEATKGIKIRLNMVNIYGNYKGDKKKRRYCYHCKEEEDITEHLIECRKVGGGIEIRREELKDGDNVKKWKEIIKKVEWNMMNRNR